MFTATFLPTEISPEPCAETFEGPLAEVVETILRHWWEDEGMTGCVLTDRSGRPVAALATTTVYGPSAGAVSVADFTDGTMTHRDVRYVVDAAGHYLETVVE